MRQRVHHGFRDGAYADLQRRICRQQTEDEAGDPAAHRAGFGRSVLRRLVGGIDQRIEDRLVHSGVAECPRQVGVDLADADTRQPQGVQAVAGGRPERAVAVSVGRGDTDQRDVDAVSLQQGGDPGGARRYNPATPSATRSLTGP